MNKDFKIDEFDALIKITVEMSSFLYPYIRNILQSKEDNLKNSLIWSNFKKRFIELISERYNKNSMKVKKLLNQNGNDELIIKSLLTLSLCISKKGDQKMRSFLLNL